MRGNTEEANDNVVPFPTKASRPAFEPVAAAA